MTEDTMVKNSTYCSDDSSISINELEKNELFNDEKMDTNEIKSISEKLDYCPQLDGNIIKELNDLVKKVKLNNYKKLLLGVIKFKHNEKTYIHCPIKKIKNKGSEIVFGVCNHSTSLLDTAINRRRLSAHKFQFHYLAEPPDINNVHLYFKTSESVEEVIEKIKNKEEKFNKKLLKKLENSNIYTCIYCNKINKINENNEKRNKDEKENIIMSNL